MTRVRGNRHYYIQSSAPHGKVICSSYYRLTFAFALTSKEDMPVSPRRQTQHLLSASNGKQPWCPLIGKWYI